MKRITLLFGLILLVLSCGKGNFDSTAQNPPVDKTSPSDPSPTPSAPSTPPVTTAPETPAIVSPELNICSKLDFSNIHWPEALTFNEKNYLALALNISGSFEGRKNWANLSNNFDGMGISLGILQQNLGMGSLQPLLLEAMDLVAQGHIQMDSEKHKLINQMVRQWKTDMSQSSNQNDLDELFKEDFNFISELDQQEGLSQLATDYSINKGSNIFNKKSVTWALSELYIDGGKTFRMDWAKALNTLAIDKEYISIQVKTAYKLYMTAIKYFRSFGLTELRSFLTMYDFVVQNGGFKKKVLVDYTAYLKGNPQASETQKLNKILELRLQDVLSQWQSDVSARKLALINSVGMVHGAKRNLPQEYCYQQNDKIITKP